MTDWYDYPVTHGYITSYEGPNTDSPHYAEDIGTPFHTRLTAPTSGTVKVADYQQWGGEIFVQPDDRSLPEWYMYHPDEIEVHAGQHVNAGQEIALSGGENPGYPGSEHPAQPQWSSGPHTHVGWFTRWITPTETGQTIPFGPDPTNLLQMAHGGGGQPNGVPANIYNAVEPVAQRYGVPDPIWETVAYAESGFNPQAIGDNGTSFGLFQLHRGGQLSNLTEQQAFDVSTNAETAMPAIASAWHSLSGTFDASSASWWQSFAAQSGHPGGAPGETITDNEAAHLRSDYGQFASGGDPTSNTTTTCTPPTGLNALNPAAWLSYASCQAQNAAAGSAQQATAGVVGWLGATSGPFLLRVGVGIAGIALIWLGANEIAAGLKGESGTELIQDNVEKAKETGAPNKEKKPMHEGEKAKKPEEKSKESEEEEQPEAETEAGGAEASEAAGSGEAAAAAAL